MKIIFFILILFPLFAHSDECLVWFKNAKIKKDKDCVLKCMSTQVDMGTFNCPSKCGKLCNIPPSDKDKNYIDLNQITGLTNQELILATKHPFKMRQSLELAKSSATLCSNYYPEGSRNGISDACRHFVWAGILYEKYGRQFSSQVLNAHEQNELQPIEEKAMGLANNRLGQLISGQLIKEGKFNRQELLNSFKKSLDENKIIILDRKKGTNKKGD